MTPTLRRWPRYLFAILLGNVVYFAASSHLPPGARDAAGQIGLGTLVDFSFCVGVYGLIELGALLLGRGRPGADAK
ncbi:MAG TPA: hypothetical protein VG204_02115 [Terriglobia bacterium]|nr:hypothetical protein [Terriglobia bacterium]